MSSPPGATTGGSTRFSVTLSEPKMPRSSGQIAMPDRATRLGIRFTSSRPRNTMLPSRRGTRPMIDFSVVVLPAPLRPSSVTTSPSRTSKSTPCRMWLSPYQALSPFTSSMRCPQIGGDHVGIGRDGGVVAFRQDAPACQHGDDVAQPFHHREVVLHHQDGASAADAPDQLDDAVHVTMAHAGGRFVEQHHLGIQ